MTSIEETGKNVEEATQRALEQLGVTEDQVDVEILEEGSKGFLGLGQAGARVRVTARATPVKPERKTRAKKVKVEEEAPAPEPEAAPEAPAAMEEITEETLQQAAEAGREVLQKILDGIGVGGQAMIRSASDDQIILDMEGSDAGILIGKHGQTIDAIQYLVGVIANRKLQAKVRVIVDAEQYRERREDALKNQALFLARRVKETGQEAVLDPLQPNERRIIHLTLADDKDIYTYSEGTEPDRHVVISPRK